MTEAFVEDVKRRAFRELRRRDGEGAFLDLNYRQKQAFKAEDVRAIRPVLDRHLKRTKRMLWWMGLSVPLLLALGLFLELYWWSGVAGVRSPKTALGFALPTLWAVFFMGYALKVALPRITAFERAHVLFDLYDEHAPGPNSQEADTVEEGVASRSFG